MAIATADDRNRALLAVCAARVRATVTRVEGFDDEIIVDLIMRHLQRCSEDDGDPPALVQMLTILIGDERAQAIAHAILPQHDQVQCEPAVWDEDEFGPPPTMISIGGPFGTAARGVEVRSCEDLDKGLGVFATRVLPPGALVGVYCGERQTFHAFWSRHGAARTSDGALAAGNNSDALDEKSNTASLDRAAAARRHARLSALTRGAPIGGANNHGAYVFRLPPHAHCEVDGERVYCIDAEDPHRSSWCRYINHAPSGSRACNLEAKCDASGNVWFEVGSEPISPGTEVRALLSIPTLLSTPTLLNPSTYTRVVIVLAVPAALIPTPVANLEAPAESTLAPHHSSASTMGRAAIRILAAHLARASTR